MNQRPSTPPDTSPAITTASGTPASIYQRLRSHLAVLKLTGAAEALPGMLEEATAAGWTVTETLERVLAVEVAQAEDRRLAGPLRFANLPTEATLEGFDLDHVTGIDASLLAELATCRWIDTATNVLLVGPPGTGKTHLAVGLARAAAVAGYRTYFTSAADLAARCHKAAIEGRWSTTMRYFAGPTLLVIDELGYLALPAEGASALFQVINQRYLKTSIVITTNRPVGASRSSATPPSPQPCSHPGLGRGARPSAQQWSPLRDVQRHKRGGTWILGRSRPPGVCSGRGRRCPR